MKGMSSKFRRPFVGPFKFLHRIENQACKLKSPELWRLHVFFHILLLKHWIQRNYRRIEASEPPKLHNEAKMNEEYEVEKDLTKRPIIRRNCQFDYNKY